MKLQRLQILRFCAATMVLAYHGIGTLANRLPDPGTLWLIRHSDYVADLFFVLSGFIISLTVRTRERQWQLFLQRRLWRIVPLYWVCTLVLAVLLPILGRGNANPIGDLGPLHLLRSMLFLAWTSAPGAMPVMYTGWSLEYEVLFYLIVTAAMAVSARPWRLVLPILATLVTAGALMGVQEPIRVLHFLFNPILIEFAFGVLIGEGLATRRIPWIEATPVALATLAVLHVEWGLRVWIAGLPSALLVLGIALLDEHAPLRSRLSLACVKLGDASYSIFISQVFSISLLVRVGVTARQWLPFEGAFALIVAGGLATAWLMYVYVEWPLRRLAHRRGNLFRVKPLQGAGAP